jgi:hypothetical protein
MDPVADYEEPIQVSKIEKKIEKVCEQTSFISDMKLYTISLQNPNKNSPVNFGASSLNFTGTLSLMANVSTRLRRVYPSRTGLKFVTFTIHRDSEDEDVDNNIHPPSPLKSANDKTKFVHVCGLVTSFVRDSIGHMVHFFQCQFLWIYDFIENLFRVILLWKRYNLFNTIFLTLFPVFILYRCLNSKPVTLSNGLVI